MVDIQKLQPITAEDNWFAAERKVLQWTVHGDAGEVEDITGWSIEFYLRNNKSSEDNLLTIEGDVPVGSDGIVQADVAAADTEGMEQRTYYYETWRVDGGSESVLAYGSAVLQ